LTINVLPNEVIVYMISLTKKTGDKTECLLCPHNCKLANGKTGICGVRKNTGGNIELMTYGVISGYSLDPVEKKPLYHYFPGHNILSMGSYGCNMKCDFCQNYHISQNIPESSISENQIDKIINDSLNADNNIGVAFTYNEPVIWFEFMRDVAVRVKNEGLHTVMVSNGFVNPGPLKEITGFIDAFNIDLKAFNNSFYKRLTGSELGPVKKSLRQIARSGKHLEVTTLIIPGENDDEKEMEQQTKWMADELGKEIPFHLSRYFPTYKRNNPPTTEGSLKKLFEIASENLDYVYLGNSHSASGQNTACSKCGSTVTIRSGYETKTANLDNEGKCTGCGNLIYRNFIFS
jgi:pyruvate formate lyase activating enzyme